MKKKVFSIALAIVLIFSFSIAYATEVETENTVEIPNLPDGILPNDIQLNITEDIEDIKNPALVDALISANPSTSQEKIDGNKIIAEDDLVFKDSNINGNLIIFANNIDLKNVSVNGDVAIFGRDIKLQNLSVTNGATVIAGQDIEVNMLLTTGNAYIAGQDIEATMVAKDLYSACAELKLTGETEISKVYNYSGNLVVEAGNYDVIKANVENLSVESNVVINENLKYESENEANIVPDAKIANVDFTKTEKKELEEKRITTEDILKSKVNSILTIVVKAAIVCGFIFLCAEGFIKKTKIENPVKYLGFSALKGLGWSIVFPIVSIMLLLTGFGASTAIAIIGIYLIIFWAGVPIVSIAIMNAILKDMPSEKKKAYGITILISLCLGILGQIPVIGGLVKTLVAFAGFGIFMGTLNFSKKTEMKDEKAEEIIAIKEVEETKKVEEPKVEDNNSEDNK